MFKSISFLVLIWYVNTSFQICTYRSLRLSTAAQQKNTFTTTLSNLEFYTTHTLSLVGENEYHIALEQPYTAIRISALDSQSNTITISTTSETNVIGSTAEDKNIDIPASFILFSKSTSRLDLLAQKTTVVKIELFYAPPVSLPHFKNKTKNDCQKPETISQKLWRDGLPNPKPNRTTSTVNHCVIHHSAGSNTDSNYVNTLRNIYLLHTQSNGWDDIGYNYIIAPNGLIFAGRDALGAGDEDNIVGAHFCAKNSGTMGICLLGNYNTITPSESLINSLSHLLTWKLVKENISAHDSFIHPNGIGTALPVITMHRSGCATICPGDSMALMLTALRDDVAQRMAACQHNVAVASKPTYKQLVYPNPSKGKFYVMIEKQAEITHYTITNTMGKELQKSRWNPDGLVQTERISGNYTLALYNKKGQVSSTKIAIE